MGKSNAEKEVQLYLGGGSPHEKGAYPDARRPSPSHRPCGCGPHEQIDYRWSVAHKEPLQEYFCPSFLERMRRCGVGEHEIGLTASIAPRHSCYRLECYIDWPEPRIPQASDVFRRDIVGTRIELRPATQLIIHLPRDRAIDMIQTLFP